ncbi:MAG: DsbA family protein [Alphaproteobacteria bacterium]|nr:DsbA family protein [Alphaproteobacteria bacterium]
MNLHKFSLASAAVIVLIWLGLAPVSAAPATVQEAMSERVLGTADAPVTIIEFASLTCPHCKDFEVNVLPKLKTAYIDTGKVKLVYRDFPLDGRALLAAMTARCAPKDRYFAFLDALFRGQDSWARAQDTTQALGQVARLGGMSQADFDACIKNQALFEAIKKDATDAQQQYKIESTPTFIINGKKMDGAHTFESFEAALKPLLK